MKQIQVALSVDITTMKKAGIITYREDQNSGAVTIMH